MIDEKLSQPIEQQPQRQGTNIPPPDNLPTGQNAAQVRDENENSRIANLEDKMRSAERIMAWLTGAIALFALGSVVVGLLQWNVMKGQLKEMHDGGADIHTLAQTAASQLETSERPWLVADYTITSPFVLDKDGRHITLAVVLKNTGHSPSARAFMLTQIYARLGEQGIISERKKLCEQIMGPVSLPSNAPVFDDLYFPGEQIPQPSPYLSMSNEQIAAAGFLHPVIISCIAYWPNFKDVTYYTSYAFDLRRYDPAEPDRDSQFGFLSQKAKGTIPMAHLQLQRHIHGGVVGN